MPDLPEGVPLLNPGDERSEEPRRFEVRLLGPSGNEFRYVAATRLGERKAIAMAVEAHVRRHDRAPIFDVRVRRLVVEEASGSDLNDRYEY